MRSLEARELLALWERGQEQHGNQRAALLLSVVNPAVPFEDLLELNVSQRDNQLLALRELTFGRRMPAVVACPNCHERLELILDSAQLRSNPPEEGFQEIATAGYRVRFQLPTGLATAQAAAIPDLNLARSDLIRRCIVAIQPATGASPWVETTSTDSFSLPAEVEQAVVEALERVGEQVETRLDLNCPACGQTWSAAFDILDYFWREIERWAQRLLDEVHLLAAHYAWREIDILAMSAFRRQQYIQRINGATQT